MDRSELLTWQCTAVMYTKCDKNVIKNLGGEPGGDAIMLSPFSMPFTSKLRVEHVEVFKVIPLYSFHNEACVKTQRYCVECVSMNVMIPYSIFALLLAILTKQCSR